MGTQAATYVCNGLDESGTPNSESVAVTANAGHSACTNGGAQLVVGGGTPTYVWQWRRWNQWHKRDHDT